MCLHAAAGGGGGGVCKGMLDLELPLLLAGGGPVVKEGQLGGLLSLKMFLRESQGMITVKLSKSSLSHS